jgi:hypothetical protein
MTREMGSRGREVAQRVADEMGLTLVLHELVEHDLAERLQVPETAVHHRFEGGATLRERWQISRKRLAQYTAEEILELAQRGQVLIRGWGACVLLREVPHVARVRVCAPMALRERNVPRGSPRPRSRTPAAPSAGGRPAEDARGSGVPQANDAEPPAAAG